VATAASVYEATGCTVIVAYSAGNLTAAAQGRDGRIVIVADNDDSGTGLREATRAAESVGGRVVMPPAGDANDYARSGGDLAALLAPPQTGWLIPADDFAGQPSPIRWIVKRWIQRDALHMIHGPSGSGKTFAVLDMILTAAAGLPEWCGHRVSACPVVYLAGEGHHGLRARIAGWKLARHAGHLQAWVSRAGDDLNTPGGLARVQDALRALPDQPAIIVVDTLHRFLAGDENSAQDAKTMLDACAALQAEFEAAVILVHHTGVSDEAQHRARGSSAWRGALDIEISVVPGTAEKPLEIVQRKSKDAELARTIYATLSSVTLPWLDEDGEQVTTAVLQQDDAPVMSSASRANIAAKKRLEEAALHLGSLYPDGSVYLSARDWQDAYTSGIGQPDGKKTTREAAVRMCQRDKKALISDGVITEADGGYKIDQRQGGDIMALIIKNKQKQ
jgi:KaiC/GvpD/RAD55 family RecA-like ATPase